ncbi:MAG: DNA-binding response regulator [Chloroflexi bacterium]|nr:MAG: DNA-binding response regulator [Chloroflexota bacterium]
MEKMRVLVVDDHALMRRGLVETLAEMESVKVVGEAENGTQAVEMVIDLDPEIVLMDVHMPEGGGVEAVRMLKKDHQHPASIIMLTISDRDDDLIGALEAGADGYLLKNIKSDDLILALKQVRTGQGILDPAVTSQVMRAVKTPQQHDEKVHISRREQDVLDCIVEGQTTEQIAANLIISPNTVKTHISNILRKLNVSNRREAISQAISQGLVKVQKE